MRYFPARAETARSRTGPSSAHRPKCPRHASARRPHPYSRRRPSPRYHATSPRRTRRSPRASASTPGTWPHREPRDARHRVHAHAGPRAAGTHATQAPAPRAHTARRRNDSAGLRGRLRPAPETPRRNRGRGAIPRRCPRTHRAAARPHPPERGGTRRAHATQTPAARADLNLVAGVDALTAAPPRPGTDHAQAHAACTEPSNGPELDRNARARVAPPASAETAPPPPAKTTLPRRPTPHPAPAA